MKRFVPALVAFAVCAPALFGPPVPPQPRLLWTFPGPVNPPHVLWTMAAAGSGRVFAVVKGESWTFTTENGTFTETGSTVVALDAAAGKPLWKGESRWPILSPLLLVDSAVIAHNGYGEVLAWEAAAGRKLWHAERELHPGSWDEQTIPSAGNGRIFLREENDIVARGLGDGKPAWRAPIGGVSNVHVYPALAEGRLLIADAMEHVTALDAGTGAVLWRRMIDRLGEAAVPAPPVVLVRGADALCVLALHDGRTAWRILNPKTPRAEAAAELRFENPVVLAVRGKRAFVLSRRTFAGEVPGRGSEILAWDLEKSAVVWSRPAPAGFQGFSLAGPLALLVHGGSISAWDAGKGWLAWTFSVPGEDRLQGQPLAVDGRILAVGSKGLHCLETGDPRITGWNQAAGGPSRSNGVR